MVMSIKKLLAEVRKADEMFGLIKDGDKIGVGISGGKDSALLVYVLHLYQYLCTNSLNKTFSLVGIHINLNFGEESIAGLEEFYKENNIDFYKEDSKIADILKLNLNKEKIDCSLCSTLKKGSAIKAAKSLGCNKIAFAHHGDDAIETLFLNMIYGGRISTFDPKMYLTNSDTTFIRPFCLSFESEIRKTANELKLPIIKSGCPNDGYTKRQEIKELLHSIYHTYPGSKKNFLLSLYNHEKVNLYIEPKAK